MSIDELCAQGAYMQALEALGPGDPARGEILYWLDHPEARDCLSTEPAPQSSLAKARLCWREDRYQEGLDLLDGLPVTPEAQLTRGLILLCLDRDGVGEALICQALGQLSGHRLLRAFQDLGVTYQFKGMHHTAVRFYRKALEGWRAMAAQHPEAAAAIYGLAGSLEKVSPNADEFGPLVEEYLNWGGPQHPHWAQMTEALASWHLRRKQWAAAEPLVVQLIARVPRPNFDQVLGQLRFMQGKSVGNLSPPADSRN